MTQTDLGKRISERADRDGLPADHELRQKARAFDDAATGFYAEPQTVDVKKFMGAYARVKLAWRDYSGEALV